MRLPILAALTLLVSAPLDAAESITAVPPAAGGAPGVRRLEDIERQEILAALKRHGGNRATTAAELGISLRTLYYRLDQYRSQGFDVGE